MLPAISARSNENVVLCMATAPPRSLVLPVRVSPTIVTGCRLPSRRDAAAQVRDVVADLDRLELAARPRPQVGMDAATARPRVVPLDDAAGDDAGVIVEIHAAAVPDGVVADHAVVGEHAGDVRDTDAAAGVGRVVALHEIAQDARGALEHADAAAVVAAGVVGHAVVGERDGALVDVDAAAVVHRRAARDRARP